MKSLQLLFLISFVSSCLAVKIEEKKEEVTIPISLSELARQTRSDSLTENEEFNIHSGRKTQSARIKATIRKKIDKLFRSKSSPSLQ